MGNLVTTCVRVRVNKGKTACLGVPGGRYDTRSLWDLYKMHETLWFCLVSGLSY